MHGLHLLDLASKHCLWGGRTVDTVSFDGDDEVTAVFQELMSVESNDTGLVGLGYIREDNVHHADQHSVFVGMSGVLREEF